VFAPATAVKDQAVPLAYSKLLVSTLPAAAFPVKVALPVVISPFANIILAAVSPIEKPPIEFKALIAILMFLLFTKQI
jgi:hypothetical protein